MTIGEIIAVVVAVCALPVAAVWAARLPKRPHGRDVEDDWSNAIR